MSYHEFFATRAAVRYFDLSSDQKKVFQEKWQSFARKLALGKVENVAMQLQYITSADNPLGVVEQLRSAGADVLVEACSDFAPLMATLSEGQLEHFKEKLEERNKKFDPEKQGNLVKYRKSKREESIDNIEDWLGRVSQTQKSLLMKLDEKKDELSSGSWEKQYLNYSRDSQDAFLSILVAHRGDSPKLSEACQQFSLTPEKFLKDSSRQFKEKLAVFRQYSLREWMNSLENDQREHLKKEIKKLADELIEWGRTLRLKS